MRIKLNSVNDVKDFIEISSKCIADVGVSSGIYNVDGKSIMGVFSLDLSKPVEAVAAGDDSEVFYEMIEKFKM